jgi:oxidoreductase domain protein
MNGKQIGVAVIGNGQRAKYVVGNLLRDSDRKVKIVSVYDPDVEVSKACMNFWDAPDAKICGSCEEAVNMPGVDWVMVFSPNACHKEGILAGFAAGKHVFSEKPLATTIDDCRVIYEAHQKSGLLFATGFVLRYAPIYRRVKKILDSGVLGSVIAVEANENITPDHGGYIMRNWRRHTSAAGPHILEKCCHDLDLLLWFIGSLPSRVASFGGRNFFTPANAGLMDKYGKKTFCTWPDPHATDTPFTEDTDLMDNSVSAAEFRNGVRVTFTATMSNAMPERRMLFSCSEGTLSVELYSKLIRYKRLGSDETVEVSFCGDGHGGGDSFIMKELYETMCTGALPKCSGSEGLQSAVFALAMDEAARKGAVVDLEPVWNSLGR